MTIPLATGLPAQRLATDLLGLPPRPGAWGARNQDSTAQATAAGTPVPGSEPATDSVVLTRSGRAENAAIEPKLPVVYAEVWRDGIKVAMIDARGGVKALSSLVQSLDGTGGAGGILLAARRAAEIAAAIGGEIRVGGQPVDQGTLANKAKLTAAYGV